MSEFRKAKPRIQVSPGESVRIMRELQELSQKSTCRSKPVFPNPQYPLLKESE